MATMSPVTSSAACGTPCTVHTTRAFHTYDNTQWGAALGILNAGLSIAGGLSAIYTLGSSSIGLEVKEAPSKTLNSGYGFGYKG